MIAVGFTVELKVRVFDSLLRFKFFPPLMLLYLNYIAKINAGERKGRE
jgi:hypothetical protein